MNSGLFIFSVVVMWLSGGQFCKPMRRYGIPAVCALFAHSWPILLLAVPLSVGYGENSWVKSWLNQSETMIRVVMAALISSMLIMCGSRVDLWIVIVVFAMNIAAWKVQEGSFGKIGKYDILIEDICRSVSLGVSILLTR